MEIKSLHIHTHGPQEQKCRLHPAQRRADKKRSQKCRSHPNTLALALFPQGSRRHHSLRQWNELGSWKNPSVGGHTKLVNRSYAARSHWAPFLEHERRALYPSSHHTHPYSRSTLVDNTRLPKQTHHQSSRSDGVDSHATRTVEGRAAPPSIGEACHTRLACESRDESRRDVDCADGVAEIVRLWVAEWRAAGASVTPRACLAHISARRSRPLTTRA